MDNLGIWVEPKGKYPGGEGNVPPIGDDWEMGQYFARQAEKIKEGIPGWREEASRKLLDESPDLQAYGAKAARVAKGLQDEASQLWKESYRRQLIAKFSKSFQVLGISQDELHENWG